MKQILAFFMALTIWMTCGCAALAEAEPAAGQPAPVAQAEEALETGTSGGAGDAPAEVAQAAAEPEESPAPEMVRASASGQENILIPQDDTPTIDLYKDYSYVDPQWVPDEALFGVWNGTGWVPQQIPNGINQKVYTVDQPLIKYDLEKYSKYFVPMEEAAKQGDYATCKALLLEHYKEKYDSLPGKPTGSSARWRDLLARISMYNMFITNSLNPIDIFEVGQERGWTEIELTETMQQVANETSADKGLNLELVALEKDGYKAEFDSKESGNVPRLEVELSDGTKKIYYPEADATIKSGSNKNNPYGEQSVLEVEESVSSIGTDTLMDENTCRAVIQFPVKDLTAADVVTKAAVYVYGNTSKPGNKQLVAFRPAYNSKMKDNSFCWMTMTNHAVISAYGEDNPNLKDLSNLGLNIAPNIFNVSARFELTPHNQLYLATGNEEYAYHALRILLGVAMKRGMLGGPENTSNFWPFNVKLSLGNRGQTMHSRYRELIHSKYMTPEVFAVLFKLAWTTGEQLEYCWQTQELTTNWGNTQATALLCMAMNFDEFNDVYKPVEEVELHPQKPGRGKAGGWLDLSSYRLLLKSAEILFEDDSCSEIPMGYTDYAINGLCSAYSFAEKAGNEALFPKEIIQTIERGTKYMIFSSAPDFSGWALGNGHEHEMQIPVDRARWLYERKLTDDPTILWVATGGKQGKRPAATSAVYAVGKKFITRSGWDADAVGSHFNADGGNNVHGHADDLSFNLFGYGEHLLIDNGVVGYDDSDTRGWQISTRAHNTVEINGISQITPRWDIAAEKKDPFTGETLYLTEIDLSAVGPHGEPAVKQRAFRGDFHNAQLNSGYDYIRGVTYANQYRTIGSKKFDDFRHERSVFFARPDYYIISDYMEPLTHPASENQYDQRWHFMPGVTAEIDAETGVAKTKGGKASVVIAPVQRENKLDATLQQGIYDVYESNEHVKYQKTAQGAAVMDTVIYPVAPGGDVDVVTTAMELNAKEQEATAFSAVITDKRLGNVKTLVKMEKHNDRGNRTELTFGNYSSDGYLAFTETANGKTTAAALQGGTFLKDQNHNYLIKSGQPLEGFSASWNGKTLELATDKQVVRDKDGADPETEIDLHQLTVFSPAFINKVTLNGVEISFHRSGRYVYFGAEPVVVDTEKEPEEEKDTPSVNPLGGGHGNANTGGGGGTGGNNPGGGTGIVPPEDGKIKESYRKELETHWGRAEITWLIENGVVQGEGDTLNLSGNVTRAEFLALLVRVMHVQPERYAGGFEDVAGDEWYAGVVQAAAGLGLAEGDGGRMRPNDWITREEMAKLLIKAVEVMGKSGAPKQEVVFQDADQVAQWAKHYVEEAAAYGLIKGGTDGHFEPQSYALREQTMVVIYRLAKLG